MFSKSLSRIEASALMRQMMMGELSDDESSSTLLAFNERGVTPDELAGLAEMMCELAPPIHGHEDAIDVCGTGGSGLSRINTSTISAFVLAAGDVKVAKHGNRAASGRCGSFDVLEALGVTIELDAAQVERCLDETGLGFIYARRFHPSMRFVAPVRQQLGVRTVFNFLGPLTNPAKVTRQVLGVSDLDMAEVMIESLKALGHTHVLVVCGSDGLDEITLSGPTTMFELKDGAVERRVFTPEDVGLERASNDEFEGGDVKENAEVARAILMGDLSGPKRDLVVVNSAAGFVVADRVSTMSEGLALANQLLESGLVNKKFEQLARLTSKL